jgi:betaine-aldehyde dehydrogenase
VERHVADAVAAGARALTGGKATDGFFEPTVLTGVDHSMTCMREETFGPTIPVMQVADADEAIQLANDSAYGLSATVWTRNRARGERIAARLDAGAVNINDSFANILAMSLPQSGWKDSGTGARFGGPHALRKYCREQAVTAARIPLPKQLPLWYPYTARKRQIVRRALEAASGRSLQRLARRRG